MQGAFFPDGSFDAQAFESFRKGTHRLVEHLCTKRRSGSLTPELAAREIEQATGERAFPNHKQWETCSDWALAWCSTSAEEAVKRAGIGWNEDRHWCSGSWVAGKEKECHNPRHRERPSPEEISRLVETLKRALD